MALPFDRFIRRLSLIWVLSLTAIGIVSLASDLLFGRAVALAESQAVIVNLAGRQRTLSQQIALQASRYVLASGERPEAAMQLRRTVDVMIDEFDQIVSYTEGDPLLAQAYSGDQTVSVRSVNRAYWQAADLLLAVPPDELSLAAPAYEQIMRSSGDVLKAADDAVGLLLERTVTETRRLNIVNHLRLTLLLVLLIGQFTLAFRPAVNRLRHKAAVLQHEVEERKRVERDLRSSEQRFRSLVENAPVGIFEIRDDGSITWANPFWENIMDLHDGTAVGTAWMDRLHPDDREAVLGGARRSAEDSHPFQSDFRIVRHDQTVQTMHATVIPMPENWRVDAAYLGMMIDITERKFAEQQAITLEAERQRVKVLGEFVRDTSHDLRTPLAVIKSGLYLCGRSTDVDRIHEKVAVIDEHVSYLTTVIEQLQDMAVLDTLTDLTLSPMEIAPLLRDAVKDLSGQAEVAGAMISVDADPNVPPVLVAPDKLLHALRAVTGNALRHGSTSGHVAVSCRREGPYAVITVRDDGPGIGPEHVARVFDRFYKVDKARGIGGGAGLGLPLARRVIELHGGELTLESAPGGGTTVRMTLLIAESVAALLI